MRPQVRRNPYSFGIAAYWITLLIHGRGRTNRKFAQFVDKKCNKSDEEGWLFLYPVGSELGNEEIVSTRLRITIKPAIGGACNEDVPD